MGLTQRNVSAWHLCCGELGHASQFCKVIYRLDVSGPSVAQAVLETISPDSTWYLLPGWIYISDISHSERPNKVRKIALGYWFVDNSEVFHQHLPPCIYTERNRYTIIWRGLVDCISAGGGALGAQSDRSVKERRAIGASEVGPTEVIPFPIVKHLLSKNQGLC